MLTSPSFLTCAGAHAPALQALANAPLDRGLYVGLRLDGRVRASGTGCPPWRAFAAQLPPMEGFFGAGGIFDGMDGRVL